MKKYILLLICAIVFQNCKNEIQEVVVEQPTPFLWENATIYFLLTDRFNNGDTTNDVNFFINYNF